ncbi:hypothetical protein BB561_006226 [Smittium simulii]|uniref:Uncharacterized protein n=1 Tax=Smittium simulii TaxID=133385 RepID=A0A2T9Y5Q8_9FUNG|nr:hypothetical protein BB561_006226 [Smittium simulii]
MFSHFLKLAAIAIFVASDAQGSELKFNNVKNSISTRDSANYSYNKSEFSTSCSLPNYILAPKGSAGPSFLLPYLSSDYIKVPCNNKYFHMTFDAEFLSSIGFYVLMNPKVFNEKYPSFIGHYVKDGRPYSASVYTSQMPSSAQGKPSESKAACGNSFGKGIKYFLAYDSKGIHIGHNDVVYATVPASRAPAVFKASNMIIQVGSGLDGAVAVSNVNIKCLSSDRCGVSQVGSPTVTLNDVSCIINQKKPDVLPPADKVVTVTATVTTTKSIVSTVTTASTITTTKLVNNNVVQTITSTVTTVKPTTVTSTYKTTVTVNPAYKPTVTVTTSVISTKLQISTNYWCKSMQQVVDVATRTLAKCGKSAAMVRLRQELSLTDLNRKTALARTRAFSKWINSHTWISDLIKTPYKHRCDTWGNKK